MQLQTSKHSKKINGTHMFLLNIFKEIFYTRKTNNHLHLYVKNEIKNKYLNEKMIKTYFVFKTV